MYYVILSKFRFQSHYAFYFTHACSTIIFVGSRLFKNDS